MMLRIANVVIKEGDERRWHRATVEFVMDDAGFEVFQRMLTERFGKTQVEVDGEIKALPLGPIEGEFIE